MNHRKNPPWEKYAISGKKEILAEISKNPLRYKRRDAKALAIRRKSKFQKRLDFPLWSLSLSASQLGDPPPRVAPHGRREQ
jgi:hypothetical protein